MAFNKSENKIRVAQRLGFGVVGLMDPAVDMNVHFGIDSRWIVALDSGNFQVGLALASGGTVCAKAYPHMLMIDTPTASGFGWPNIANEPVGFGHSGVFPGGVPVGVGSGMYYQGGDSLIHLVNRPIIN
jgi:hypothetical protein